MAHCVGYPSPISEHRSSRFLSVIDNNHLILVGGTMLCCSHEIPAEIGETKSEIKWKDDA